MRISDWSSDVCSSDLQVHPDDIARVEAAVTAHLEGRSEFYETEHRVRHRSAGWVWMRSRGKVVARESDGNPTRIAGTARDISQDRSLDSARLIASEELR